MLPWEATVCKDHASASPLPRGSRGLSRWTAFVEGPKSMLAKLSKSGVWQQTQQLTPIPRAVWLVGLVLGQQRTHGIRSVSSVRAGSGSGERTRYDQIPSKPAS